AYAVDLLCRNDGMVLEIMSKNVRVAQRSFVELAGRNTADECAMTTYRALTRHRVSTRIAALLVVLPPSMTTRASRTP
ncbi:hypothetical protein QN357_19480, partial [Cryobacterium sp. RTC2.1]|uniref:hypothetical protein n=1 Tax=Cryobacterium sp. RTC2.1 TaxID=3048634 RepID=UPI002B22D318